MNILHLRYAIEVERTRSVSRAAENLFMNQSNLSRAIRELEQSLGITLFRRTSKGMTPTQRGEEFLAHAKRIIAEVDRVETLYRPGGQGKLRFSLAAPGCEAVRNAFAAWAAGLPAGTAEISWRRTDAKETVAAVLEGDCQFGILRYPADADDRVRALLKEKDLAGESVADLPLTLLLSAEDALAAAPTVELAALADYTEVADATLKDSIPLSDRVILAEGSEAVLSLLATLPRTYARLPRLSDEAVRQAGLVQKELPAPSAIRFHDLLIYRKGYHFTPEDTRFVKLLLQ